MRTEPRPPRGPRSGGSNRRRKLLAGALWVLSPWPAFGLTSSADPVIGYTRSALVDRFLGDRDGLESALEAIRRIDVARARDHRDDTGLADQLLYLRNSAVPSREEYLHELRDSLRDDPDPFLAGRIRWAMASDEVVTAQRLLGAARRNRVAKLINDAARPLGRLTSIALSGLNPALALTAALDSITATGGNLWHWHRPSAEEREALHRYREHLRRESTAGDSLPPARMHRLAERVAAADCERALRRARTAAVAEPAIARAHLDAAKLIPGCQARAERETFGRMGSQSTAPNDPRLRPQDPLPRIPEAVAPAYYEMLLALVRAEPAAIRGGAQDLRESPADSALADEARYAETVAADLEGRHEDALTDLRALADEPSSNMGRQARDLLRQPGTDRFAGLRAAVKDHRWARVRYVLIGRGRKPIGTAQGLARAGLRGLQGLQNLGLFNVFGVVGRSVQLWRGDPISNGPIIAGGEDLLAREPQSPHGAETHEILADAYARSGEYERALFHLVRTEVPEKRVERLRERAASRLLRVARDGDFGPLARRRALDLVVAHYPETKSADKARGMLDKLSPPELVQLPAAILRTDRTLAPRLGLPPEWLDGRSANGELADGEVRLVDGGRLFASVDMAEGRTEQSLSLDSEELAVFVATASETQYLTAARDASSDHGGAPFERFVPFFVEGSLGASGISVVPGLKPSSVQSDQRELYDED